MGRKASLKIGDLFHSWEITEKLSVTTQGTRYKLICNLCGAERDSLAKNIHTFARCKCQGDAIKSAKILLMFNGIGHTIKECAQLVSPDNPERAENGIRYRLHQRNQGKPLTDSQIIFGITNTGWNDQPIERGLPKDVSLWVKEAIDLAIPIIDEHLRTRISAYIVNSQRKAGKVIDRYRAEGVQTVGTTLEDLKDNVLNQGESLTPAKVEAPITSTPQAVSLTPFNPLQAAKDWLKANNYVDLSYTWMHGLTQTVSELLAEYTKGEENPNYQFQYDCILAEFESDKKGREEKRAQREAIFEPIDPTKMVVSQGSNPLSNFIHDKTHLSKLPAYDEKLYPPLSVQELEDYENRTFMKTFMVSDIYRLKNCVVGRTLTNMTEFLLVDHNPKSIATNKYLWCQGPIGFHDRLLYDLSFRCWAQVRCHRSFNRAMELWFMGVLMSQPNTLSEEPQLLLDIIERCNQLKVSVIDLKYTLGDPFNRIDRCEEWGNPIFKLLMEIDQEVAFEDLDRPARLVSRRNEEGKIEYEFESILLPEGYELHEEDYDYVKKMLSTVAVCGRNRARWPKEWKEAELRYPDLIPVKLYNDPTRDIDYTVYDDAPLSNDGLWRKLKA